jgi:flagellar biosynthetic protein FliO
MFNSPMLTGLIPLFIIIMILGTTLLVVKKYAFKFGKKNLGTVEIKTIASHMIAPKKYISVVKVQNELLLLGISDNSVSLLKELNSLQEPEQGARKTHENRVRILPEKKLKSTPEPAPAYINDNSDFAAILKKNLGIK